jgi:predicted MFS family arabinose efflux permease
MEENLKPKKEMSNLRRWIAILTFGMANGVIYLLPYAQYSYYDAMKNGLNYSHTEMGTMISVFGIVNAILYPVGGLVLDKWAKDKLFIILALIMTGIGGFVFAMHPPYVVAMLVHILWGFTTTFLFWTAYINGKRKMATGKNVGRVFGISETFSMVIGMVASTTSLALFTAFGNNYTVIMIYYGILNLIGAAICVFTLPKDLSKKEVKEHAESVDLKEGLGYLVKRKDIWYISVILFCSYGIGMTIGKLSPYLTAIFGMSVTIAAFVGMMTQYGVPMPAAIAGGFIADKMQSATNFIKYCFIYLAIAAVILIALPSGVAKLLPVAIIFGLSIKLIQVMQRGAYWVPLTDTRIPEKYAGTAIGLCSFLGFIPEAFLNTVWGAVLDAHLDNPLMGYRIIWCGVMVMAIIGFIFSQLLMKDFKKRGCADAKGRTIVVEPKNEIADVESA